MPDRVLASATVHPLFGGNTLWRVQTWGQPPHDKRRSYTIKAESDSLAAQEGIRRFVAEMEGHGREVEAADNDRDPSR